MAEGPYTLQWDVPSPQNCLHMGDLGSYSRKVVNGGRSYHWLYAELTASVVIRERNGAYDRSHIQS